MKKIDLSKYEELLKRGAPKPPDFPSIRHEVAWDLAQYFNEPYSFWVRMVRDTKLLAGQIRHEYTVLRKKDFTRRQRARMLLKTMFPNKHKT